MEKKNIKNKDTTHIETGQAQNARDGSNQGIQLAAEASGTILFGLCSGWTLRQQLRFLQQQQFQPDAFTELLGL